MTTNQRGHFEGYCVDILIRKIGCMRIQINFNPQERSALDQLAQRERRNARDQAALIVRRELERLGLIETETKHADETKTA